MDDIEQFLNRTTRGIGGPASLQKHLKEELREHLDETIQEYVSNGMAEEEARQKTLQEFGGPEQIREEFEAVYGRRLTSLLIGKAMDWRERTMKMEWKWNFLSQMFFDLLIGAQILFIYLVALFILPGTERLRVEVLSKTGRISGEIGIPSIETIYRLAFLGVHQWFVPFLLAGVAIALFEWKYRRDNKTQVRLAISSIVSFGLMVFIFLASLTLMVHINNLGMALIEYQAIR